MTLQQKMILSGVISVLAAVALGGIGYWGQTQMATALAHNQLTLQAMRNHLEGDMMHDGLRADVLNAFVIDSSDSAAVSQLRSDLREHNSVVITALSQPFDAGLVLDPWRNSGELFWAAVRQDDYPWEPLPPDQW